MSGATASAPLRVCPRCRSEDTEHVTVAGVWTVFGCDKWFYSWSSTEPLENIDLDSATIGAAAP